MRQVLAPSAEAALLAERPLRRTAQTVAAAALAAGVVLFAVHDVVPSPWNGVSDSPALWCLLAWVAGQWVRPPAALSAAASGVVALWCLLAGFYAGVTVLAGRGEDPTHVAELLVLATAAGAVFGSLGRLRWVRGPLGLLAAGLLGAVFTVEALRYPLTLFLFALQPVPEGVEHILPTVSEDVFFAVYAALGVVVAAVAAPSGRRGPAVGVTLLLTFLGAAVVGVPVLSSIGVAG